MAIAQFGILELYTIVPAAIQQMGSGCRHIRCNEPLGGLLEYYYRKGRMSFLILRVQTSSHSEAVAAVTRIANGFCRGFHEL
jgi:hypothetical protein